MLHWYVYDNFMAGNSSCELDGRAIRCYDSYTTMTIILANVIFTKDFVRVLGLVSPGTDTGQEQGQKCWYCTAILVDVENI